MSRTPFAAVLFGFTLLSFGCEKRQGEECSAVCTDIFESCTADCSDDEECTVTCEDDNELCLGDCDADSDQQD